MLNDQWSIVHCCTLSLYYLGAETDDQHRNPNIKNRNHPVEQLLLNDQSVTSDYQWFPVIAIGCQWLPVVAGDRQWLPIDRKVPAGIPGLATVRRVCAMSGLGLDWDLNRKEWALAQYPPASQQWKPGLWCQSFFARAAPKPPPWSYETLLCGSACQ